MLCSHLITVVLVAGGLAVKVVHRSEGANGRELQPKVWMTRLCHDRRTAVGALGAAVMYEPPSY